MEQIKQGLGLNGRKCRMFPQLREGPAPKLMMERTETDKSLGPWVRAELEEVALERLEFGNKLLEWSSSFGSCERRAQEAPQGVGREGTEAKNKRIIGHRPVDTGASGLWSLQGARAKHKPRRCGVRGPAC